MSKNKGEKWEDVRFFDAVVATVSHLLHVLAIDVHARAGEADGHELVHKTQLLKHGQNVDILFEIANEDLKVRRKTK
jgi:hypothetical protein